MRRTLHTQRGSKTARSSISQTHTHTHRDIHGKQHSSNAKNANGVVTQIRREERLPRTRSSTARAHRCELRCPAKRRRHAHRRCFFSCCLKQQQQHSSTCRDGPTTDRRSATATAAPTGRISLLSCESVGRRRARVSGHPNCAVLLHATPSHRRHALARCEQRLPRHHFSEWRGE